MPTRNISLTEHFDRFVEDRIASGRYLNASKVVRDRLRLLEQRTREEELKMERLREAAVSGFREIDRGQFHEIGAGDLRSAISSIGKRAAARRRKTPA